MKNIKLAHYFLLVLLAAATAACTTSTDNSANLPGNNSNTASIANSQPAGTPAAGSAEAQTDTPELLVANLYKQHDAKKSPFFQTKNRALVDKYFTKATADLIWKDAVGSKGEIGAIDFDPLYDGQDFEIKNFAVGKSDTKGETATVPANFTNYGEKRTVTFALKRVADNWKIDDIKYLEGNSLLKILKAHFASTPDKEVSSGGEFEGKYQVGDTSCTVKPVKMAFEIKWAKGTGTEMFFSAEANTFESEASKGETNRFVFDDENYNSGTFYRGDGKTFAVKRAN